MIVVGPHGCNNSVDTIAALNHGTLKDDERTTGKVDGTKEAEHGHPKDAATLGIDRSTCTHLKFDVALIHDAMEG